MFMDIKKVVRMIFNITATGVFLFSFSLNTSASGQNEIFDNSSADSLHSGVGTVEFNVKLLKDLNTDQHSHTLLVAISADGNESYDIVIIENEITARRYFGRCLLTAFSSPYSFKIGEWHNLKLTWNDVTTKFYIDNQEVPREALLSGDDRPKMNPGIRLAHEDGFVTGDLQSLGLSDIPINSSDKEFVSGSSCPRAKEMIGVTP